MEHMQRNQLSHQLIGADIKISWSAMAFDLVAYLNQPYGWLMMYEFDDLCYSLNVKPSTKFM